MRRLVVTIIVSLAVTATIAFSPSLSKAYAAIDWEHKGITIRLVDQTIPEINKSLDDLKDTGANYVAITPGWHTDDLTSSNVDRKSRTPSDELLVYTIERAHSLGLKVHIKPHVDPKTGEWRAKMKPSNRAEFFSNYSSMMLHYARLSETYNVELFSVGSELHGISTDPENESYWREMISQIRNSYNGELTYNANTGDTIFDESVLPFWDLLDYIGFSMYQPLSNSYEPTYDEIYQSWRILDKNYVQPMHNQYNKPVMFTEIGYRSMDGTAIDPGDYKVKSNVDVEEQKLLYKVLFDYWQGKEDYMIGIHLWDWKVDPNPGGLNDDDYTPQNKPALDILKLGFGGNGIVINESTNTNQETQNTEEELNTIKEIENIVEQEVTVTITDGIEVNTLDALSFGNTTKYRFDVARIGTKMYTDRSYTITNLPSYLVDSVLIVTSNNHKYSTSEELLTINTTKKVSSYVAYDSRATKLPTWLRDWEVLNDQIVTTDVSFKIYKKDFVEGEIIFGGNNVDSEGARSNYFILFTDYKEDVLGASDSKALTQENITGTQTQENDQTLLEGVLEGQNTEVENVAVGTTEPNTTNSETILGEIKNALNVEEPLIELPEDSVEVTSTEIEGTIIIENPKNGALLSGEKKVKIKVPDLSRELYTATISVDGREVYELEDSTVDDIKQAKIDFDTWNWNGSGPYNAIIIAKDLNGETFDSQSLKIFVRQ